MRPLPLALARFNTRLGDVDANLGRHLAFADDARRHGTELVLFPELSLTGYVLRVLAVSVARRGQADNPTLGHLLQTSWEIDQLVGFVEAEPRHRFYISSAYLSRGEVVDVHRKVYLPTHGLFDEGRFFAWGETVRAFDTRFGRMGVLICEDFWHASPPYLLWLDGADVLLFASASPGRGMTAEPRPETARWVEQINQAYASLFTCFVAQSNRTGFEDGLNFWGGSMPFHADGTLLARAPYHEEALTRVRLDLEQLH